MTLFIAIFWKLSFHVYDFKITKYWDISRLRIKEDLREVRIFSRAKFELKSEDRYGEVPDRKKDLRQNFKRG